MGGDYMAVSKKNLKTYFYNRINMEDLSIVECVDRYLDFMMMIRKMKTQLNVDGHVITTENGKQSFKKAHPLIKDIKDINAQMINLKKEIDRHIKEYERYRIRDDTHPTVSNKDLI